MSKIPVNVHNSGSTPLDTPNPSVPNPVAIPIDLSRVWGINSPFTSDGHPMATDDKYYVFPKGMNPILTQVTYSATATRSGVPNATVYCYIQTNAGERILVTSGQSFSPVQARYIFLTNPQVNGLSTDIHLTALSALGSYTPVVVPDYRASQKHAKLYYMRQLNFHPWQMGCQNKRDFTSTFYQMSVNLLKSCSTGGRAYVDRNYLEFNAGAYQKGVTKFQVDPANNGSWQISQALAAGKTAGMDISYCMLNRSDIQVQAWTNMNLSWAPSGGYEQIPINSANMSSLKWDNPASYTEDARAGAMVAAVYGSVAMPQSWFQNELKLQGSQTWSNVTGKGLVKYLEYDNERDKWWQGRRSYQAGYEYAAGLSAFYDADKNRLDGSYIGVKNVDPSMKVVIGGAATPTWDWLFGIVRWCMDHRGYKPDGSIDLCFDVINFHSYSNNLNNAQHIDGTIGASSDSSTSQAEPLRRAVLQFASEFCPGMEVWITETGWDINNGSSLKIPLVGSKSQEETHGDWTVRNLAQCWEMGISRLQTYELGDTQYQLSWRQFGSLYSNCGVVDEARMRRRIAGDYMNQMGEFDDYSVVQNLSDTTNNVKCYKAQDTAGHIVYYIVSPTQSARTLTWPLTLSSVQSITLCEHTTGTDHFKKTFVPIDSTGVYNVAVSEKPVWIMVNANGSVASQIPNQPAFKVDLYDRHWDGTNETNDVLLTITPTAGPAATSYSLKRSYTADYASSVNIPVPFSNGVITLVDANLPANRDIFYTLIASNASGNTLGQERFYFTKNAALLWFRGMRQVVQSIARDDEGLVFDSYGYIGMNIHNGNSIPLMLGPNFYGWDGWDGVSDWRQYKSNFNGVSRFACNAAFYVVNGVLNVVNQGVTTQLGSYPGTAYGQLWQRNGAISLRMSTDNINFTKVFDFTGIPVEDQIIFAQGTLPARSDLPCWNAL